MKAESEMGNNITKDEGVHERERKKAQLRCTVGKWLY